MSRGTLRLALERLESNGEVVRRQGSGTFVGRVAQPAAFSEGLEVLESYASLARRQGKRLSARNVQIEQAPVPGYIAVARKRRDILVAEDLGPSLVLLGRLADLAPRSAKVFRGLCGLK